ncbi:DUF4062 domain-containing protein [Rhodococcus cercidiphylli]|uniref:DUF4062 domain-containing protein n=1 Tax=Rhodococcus cercidiphylli TaxID=489916 RepID=A0ABU4AZV2_9NOCA|nr:DUF4062 domain-containing protein [Rhodococcus cercidiphylli]MDV6231773.1 DUF4062 domain-containing protein [Rhodococcus cercidiphylli]
MTTIPIFLSSTFRDFHRERDILVREVAPQIDDALREFGCRVDLIDLRWGVGADVIDMEDDVKYARVLSVCFDEIERARPLFVGLVGQRYGWVPSLMAASNITGSRLDVDPAGMSATALEIEYGAFASPDEAMHTLFFFRAIDGRKPVGFEDDDLTLVHGLRDRISSTASSNSQWSVNNYVLKAESGQISDFAPFTDLATKLLIRTAVERARALPERPANPLAAAESLFFESRVVVEGRETLIDQVVNLLRAGMSVCLLGESGIGKSAIWCKAIDQVNESRIVLRAAIPSSELLTSNSGVVRRLASQLGLTPPPSVDDRGLLDWWRNEVKNRDGLVVGIDGVDSLDLGGAREDLGCVLGMPATHFVTTTDHEHARRLRANGFAIVEVGPLSVPSSATAASALVKKLQRTLPQRAIMLLADRPRSPLWLQLALGEITSLGEGDFAVIDNSDPVRALSDLVEQTVAQLPNDMPSMIQRQISRIGKQLGLNPTNAILGGLALSRSGLAPVDLAVSMGVTELDVAVVRRSFGGLICECGLDGRLGFAHSAVKIAIDSSFPLTHDGYRQDLHWRTAQTLIRNAQDDQVRHADALWHAISAGSEKSAAAASEWILIGLGKGPSGLPAYVVRVLVSAVRVYGAQNAFFDSISEKVVLGVTRAMTGGAVSGVPPQGMRELAIRLLGRAQEMVLRPVHNGSIANEALASALRAAVEFDSEEINNYLAALEEFLIASKDGHSEVYLAFGQVAYAVEREKARALIDRAVNWAELAILTHIFSRKDRSAATPMSWGIDVSGWSNLCVLLEVAHHFGVVQGAPTRILRYCELVVRADPEDRARRRNYAAARIFAWVKDEAPDSERDGAVAELKNLLASQPDDEECIRLMHAANPDGSEASNHRLLRPIDGLSMQWSARFTTDERVAYGLWHEAAMMTIAAIDRGQRTAEQFHRLAMRLFVLTKFSCEPDPGAKLTQSLTWLESAAILDGSVISASSLVNYNQLTTTGFSKTEHVRSLLRIVNTIGHGWVATLIPLTCAWARYLNQSGETVEEAVLLLEAAALVQSWEYSPQFAEAREASRKHGGTSFGPKYHARSVAKDLRIVFGLIGRRNLVLRGRIVIAIAKLDQIAVPPTGP